MDPEDLHKIISAYQKCVAETVGRFGGFVAKYMMLCARSVWTSTSRSVHVNFFNNHQNHKLKHPQFLMRPFLPRRRR